MSGNKRDLKVSHEKKPLTHGWIVVPSRTYPNRVYFYNTTTKCSTWDNPCEDRAFENSSSRSSSSQGVRSRKTSRNSPAALHERNHINAYSSSPARISNTHTDSEIEDYDEEQDQYFNNVPINAFSLSHSNLISPSSSPDSASLKGYYSDSESTKCDSSLLANSEKQLWVHFLSSPPKSGVTKSVALSDLESSTSAKIPGMESTKKLTFSHNSKKDHSSKNSGTDESDVVHKRRRSRKRKKKASETETQKSNLEDKVIKNVSFKKRDKTPAQTRLLKLRNETAERLKELAQRHPDLFLSNTSDKPKSGKINIEGQSGSGNFYDAYHERIERIEICDDCAQGSANLAADDFYEEMDWEPSSEESDVRNINVFRQQTDKVNDSSSDIFFGLDSDHSLEIPSKSYSWFVVLDTNIFVSCLGFVKDLRDIKVPDLGYPVIYVPWRVLQELDHLKDTKFYTSDKHIHSNVRKAIAYLNENFKSRHPRVFGQSFEEFAKMVGVEATAPDDEILQTCINFQKEHSGKKLMLLTNDKNLESKAIVSGVEVYSKERFQKKFLRPRSVSPTFNGPSSRPTTSSGTPVRKPVEVDTYICEIKSILNTFLPLVVETEMKIAFEGDWVKLAFKKPPWNLQDALDCFLKHWRSVFFVVFSKETQTEVQRLYDRLFKKEAGNIEDIIDIITSAQRVIISIKRSQKKKRPYLEMTEFVITRLSNLLSMLSPSHSLQFDAGLSTPLVSSVSPPDAPLCNPQPSPQQETPNNDVLRVKNLFKEIWDSLRSFCCTVSDFVHSPNAFDGAVVQETKRKMCDMLAEISELVYVVEKLLEINLSDVRESHPLIIRFTNFLIRVYPSMEPDFQRELPKCLTAFFTDFEARSLLRTSINDFKEFSNDLINAIKYFNADSMS